MEELLTSVDFGIDFGVDSFEMDTSDLDCLSDDLLELNEDDLLNIDLLNSECEDEHQELSYPIDSFFAHEDEQDYKSINNILNKLSLQRTSEQQFIIK